MSADRELAMQRVAILHQHISRSFLSNEALGQHSVAGTRELLERRLAETAALDPELRALVLEMTDVNGDLVEFGQRPEATRSSQKTENLFRHETTFTDGWSGQPSTLIAYYAGTSNRAKALLQGVLLVLPVLTLFLFCFPVPMGRGRYFPVSEALFPRLRPISHVVQAVTVGLVLTLEISALAYHQEQERFDRQKWGSALSSQRILQDFLWEYEHLYAASAVAFFAASESVTTDEFERFFHWLGRVDAIHWVGVASAVPAPDGGYECVAGYFKGDSAQESLFRETLKTDPDLRRMLLGEIGESRTDACPVLVPESTMGALILQKIPLQDNPRSDLLVFGFDLGQLLRSACFKSGASDAPYAFEASVWQSTADGSLSWVVSCRGNPKSRPQGYLLPLITHHQSLLYAFDTSTPPPFVAASSLWVICLIAGTVLTTLGALMTRSMVRRQRQIENLATEHALLHRRQENLMASAFASIIECVVHTTADNRILSMNNAAAELTGIPVDEVQGRSMGEIFDTLQNEENERAFNFNLGLKELPKRINNTVLVARDGRVLNVGGYISPLLEEDGTLSGKLYVLRDESVSTLRIRSSGALVELFASSERETEEVFLQRSLDIIEKTLNSRIAFLHMVSENQQELALTAWSTATLAHYCRASYEKHYPVAKAGIWADCIRSRSPIIVNDYASHAWKIGLPQGHAELTRFICLPHIENDRICMIIGLGNAEFPYNDGDLAVLDAFARELHVLLLRFRHARAMRTQQAETRRLALATEASPASVVITDPAGTIQYVNQRFVEVSGYPREEVIGRNPRILRSPNNSTTDFSTMWKALKAGLSWEGEFHNQRKDGTQYWEWAKIAPIKDEQNEVVSFLAVKEDITERRANEARLKEMNDHFLRVAQQANAASEAKSRFIANMSHEIRTPMNGIIGMSQLLAETQLDEEQKTYLRTVVECSNNLLQTMNEILDMSKIEKGRVEIKADPFSLRELFGVIHSSFEAQIRIKGLSLQYEIDERIPEVLLGDAFHLRQVVTNLVNNAYKFTERGGIRLVARLLGMEGATAQVCIEVIDTGIGIAEDKQQLVFENFSQVDNSSTRRYDGVGLGLAISRRLVELMRGRILLKSELGKGSTFSVELRLALHPSQTDEPIREAAPEVIDRTGGLEEAAVPVERRALVIDDNVTNLRTMGFLLRKFGVIAVTCLNGKEAIATFKEQRFDFILLDILMPDMDGITVLGFLRQIGEERGRKTPVVANTAKAMVGDREGLLEMGFDDYLEKPVTLQSLGRLLDRLFD